MSGFSASRRGFLTGLAASLVAAPAVVRASSLMPVVRVPEPEILRWIVNVGRWDGLPIAVFDDLPVAFEVGTVAAGLAKRLGDIRAADDEYRFPNYASARAFADREAYSEATLIGHSAVFTDPKARAMRVGQVRKLSDLLSPHRTFLRRRS